MYKNWTTQISVRVPTDKVTILLTALRALLPAPHRAVGNKIKKVSTFDVEYIYGFVRLGWSADKLDDVTALP